MNKNRRYDVDAILRDIEQGEVHRKIAEKYGCSKPYVDSLARRYGFSKSRALRQAKFPDGFALEFDREWRKVTGFLNEQVFKKEKAVDQAEQVAAQR